MSNAEQAAEPSMEDILSSIRKIIAEEPATDAANGGDGEGDGAEFAPKPVKADVAKATAAPVDVVGSCRSCANSRIWECC